MWSYLCFLHPSPLRYVSCVQAANIMCLLRGPGGVKILLLGLRGSRYWLTLVRHFCLGKGLSTIEEPSMPAIIIMCAKLSKFFFSIQSSDRIGRRWCRSTLSGSKALPCQVASELITGTYCEGLALLAGMTLTGFVST